MGGEIMDDTRMRGGSFLEMINKGGDKVDLVEVGREMQKNWEKDDPEWQFLEASITSLLIVRENAENIIKEGS